MGQDDSIDADLKVNQQFWFDYNFSKSTKARYIKVMAKNYGDVPKWHVGAPFDGKAWIFVDEIQIK